MEKQEEQNLISWLICKQIIGTITDEEQQVLSEWRKKNEHNEAAYQRLMDTDRQQIEYQRSKMTDYRRPLEDMKRRLSVDNEVTETYRGNNTWIYKMMAAAAVLLLIFGTTLFFKGIGSSSSDGGDLQSPTIAKTEILPGTTKAILTFDNGEQLQLDANSSIPKNSSHGARTAEEQIAMNNLATPRGGEFKITLEDGTEVWLNAQSSLRYPETFEGDERRVEVTGEAYFKVAKNTEKPFYVVSGGQEVRVYGTEFNVHAYNDEAIIYTTLVEGRISLRPINGNKSELMLTPGNQAVFEKADASARVQKVDTDVVTSWRSGSFVFENQTLEQIMRTLSRWYDFQYEFVDQKIAKIVFMGSIPRYGSFSEVVDIFQKIGGIHLSLKDGKVVISAK